MEMLLSKITSQAMNYAIRTGVAITGGFAIEQCARLLKTKHGSQHGELEDLQRRLEVKLHIISPAIDMIELAAARGNTSLESTLYLTRTIRWDVQTLGVRLAELVEEQERIHRGSFGANIHAQNELQMQLITKDMERLLNRVDDSIPSISLAISTSGINLSSGLPATVSPSRLLQASMLLNAGDAAYKQGSSDVVQIGPVFTVSLYMLFLSHTQQARGSDSSGHVIWKEVIHKARVRLLRVPMDQLGHSTAIDTPANIFSSVKSSNTSSETKRSEGNFDSRSKSLEFAYQLSIVEDLDDGRFHTFDLLGDNPSSGDNILPVGIRESIPIHQISKIFYADTGKILNIGADGEANNPVLLLRRDVKAAPPQSMFSTNPLSPQDWGWQSEPDSPIKANILAATGKLSPSTSQKDGKVTLSKSSRFPSDLDPEWLALEIYAEDDLSESESDADTEHTSPSLAVTSPHLASLLSNLQLSSPPSPSSDISRTHPAPSVSPIGLPSIQKDMSSDGLALNLPPVQARLSLLEMLIRLTSLQQFQQTTHMALTDELLNYFLQDSSTTDAAPGDQEARRRIRKEARERVGFDPYDESPPKQRGKMQPSRMNQSVTPKSQRHSSSGTSEYDLGYDERWSGIRFRPNFAEDNIRSSPPMPSRRSGPDTISSSPTLGHDLMESTPTSERDNKKELSCSIESSTSDKAHKDSTGKTKQSDEYKEELLDEHEQEQPGVTVSQAVEERLREEVEQSRLQAMEQASSPD